MSNDRTFVIKDSQPPQISNNTTSTPREQDQSTLVKTQHSSELQTPSQQRLDDVFQVLYNSIKVVAVADCPVHPARVYCDCAIGVKALSTKEVHCYKLYNFFRFWDMQLLGVCKPAFDYTGGQASHHIFLKMTGKTPKHFARDFLQDSEPVCKMFRPQAKLKDTIQAMLDYWVVKNGEWKSLHGNQKQACDKWAEATLRKSPDVGKLNREVVDLVGFQPEFGKPINIHECCWGPPEHRGTFHILPFDRTAEGKGFGTVLVDNKRCHKECPVTGPLEQEVMIDIMNGIGKQCGFDIESAEMGHFSSTEELREAMEKRK